MTEISDFEAIVFIEDQLYDHQGCISTKLKSDTTRINLRTVTGYKQVIQTPAACSMVFPRLIAEARPVRSVNIITTIADNVQFQRSYENQSKDVCVRKCKIDLFLKNLTHHETRIPTIFANL